MGANQAKRMITLTKVRQLDLSAATPGRPLYLSAASGLVCLSSFNYVVADDELHLGVFRANSSEPGHLVRLFEGELPACNADRKKQKADFEALTLLPSFGNYPYGALLAFGSGSRPNRRLGALLGLDARGAVRGSSQVVDCSPILTSLDREFAGLNIEGAVVSGAELRLFQRGNQRNSQNAIIRFQLSTFLEALISEQTAAIAPLAINTFDLGQIDGIPLCFTDGTALPDGTMVFTAVAEGADDNYNDGACAGAAVGIVGNVLQCLYRLDWPHKVEGVNARVEGNVIRLLLVTDADDFEIPAALFSATIAR
jgi:uncharacterized protein DUF6929